MPIEFVDEQFQPMAGGRVARHDHLAAGVEPQSLGDHEVLGAAADQRKTDAFGDGVLEAIVLHDG